MNCEFGNLVNTTCTCFPGYINSQNFAVKNDCAIPKYQDLVLNWLYLSFYILFGIFVFSDTITVMRSRKTKDVSSTVLLFLTLVFRISQYTLLVDDKNTQRENALFFWFAFYTQTIWFFINVDKNQIPAKYFGVSIATIFTMMQLVLNMLSTPFASETAFNYMLVVIVWLFAIVLAFQKAETRPYLVVTACFLISTVIFGYLGSYYNASFTSAANMTMFSAQIGMLVLCNK